ncbi:penicillin-binding protein [Mucilaginibacter conchicola]|uniref:Penicillin-binding protein n=1 Tax=Mucilaginibacter conchicola TaxID=2303333 RepID=A0A372NQB6_9SPHI|nr:penicillin-binding protein [Mucilaginibacter conchicola]RFZ91119.1 penicillin-binding protein [Mucilaginibacter conchicola]
MTRSNMHIILTNGKKIKCVADSSSAPEQGYIVENLIQPLLKFKHASRELELIKEHCTMNEQRINATYRYEINLLTGRVALFTEEYDSGMDRFIRGEDITERYETYLRMIKN